MATEIKAALAIALLAASLTASSAADDQDRSKRPGRDYRHPEIIIDPSSILAKPPKPDVNAPGFIMAEVRNCSAAGIRLFVDCLRHNHGSIMIRQLEACLQSETIHDDPQRVVPCLPMPGPP